MSLKLTMKNRLDDGFSYISELLATNGSDKVSDNRGESKGVNGGSIPPTSTNRGVADMQRYTCPTNNGGFT